ncbi:unnamed protein product [Colias eurytheme]|nr:unnamed protein product [Colias eurytheme]
MESVIGLKTSMPIVTGGAYYTTQDMILKFCEYEMINTGGYYICTSVMKSTNCAFEGIPLFIGEKVIDERSQLKLSTNAVDWFMKKFSDRLKKGPPPILILTTKMTTEFIDLT